MAPDAPAHGASTGLFVTLEGGEGAGKSVQVSALARCLESSGRTVCRTREPGGTALGERLRDIVLGLAPGLASDGESLGLDPLSETLLFIAARAELVAAVIAPALSRGEIVVCDRFADSTLAYQGFGRGIALDKIERLNEVATGGLQPHLTVLLDLPAADGLARAGKDGGSDRFERETLDFHERVRAGYRTLAEREPERWLVIDASQPSEAVTEQIWQRLEPMLPAPPQGAS
ncbi:MAG: dTMP kinase [Chloroflexi bacterium]|nr:dTMP kinase [Chloroflexota bacterium]